VFRSRVVNPRWITAMQRHGYKGAFEMAARGLPVRLRRDGRGGRGLECTPSWPQAYVFDAEVSAFMRQSIPWRCGASPSGCWRRRPGLWAEPPPDTLDQLRAAYLELEGQLEGDGE